MKFNKWTLGLAAVGLVSWNSAASAQDAAPSTVLTSLSSTTLSGYVDTSAQWNLGSGNEFSPPYTFGGPSKTDGFNLNVVQLSLDKPLDESEWAAGYHVDMWLGPDAAAIGTASIFSGTSDFALRQAYVALRTPLGNGIDWKIGVFDTVIGYESLSSPNNPNYSHSYGFTIEPTSHTGLLGTYKINDMFNVTAGIANTFGPSINEKGHGPNNSFAGITAESYKTYMGAVAFSAPTDWGWIGGSTLSAGFVNGFNSAAGEFGGGNQVSVYAGATMNTPVSALKLGAAVDYVGIHDKNRTYNINGGDTDFQGDGTAWAAALYASFQATEKLSLHVRGEFLDDSADLVGDASELGLARAKVWSGTATAQYDLWKNVISRVEFRWDHGDNGMFFGGANASTGNPDRRNAYMVAAQVIYKF